MGSRQPPPEGWGCKVGCCFEEGWCRAGRGAARRRLAAGGAATPSPSLRPAFLQMDTCTANKVFNVLRVSTAEQECQLAFGSGGCAPAAVTGAAPRRACHRASALLLRAPAPRRMICSWLSPACAPPPGRTRPGKCCTTSPRTSCASRVSFRGAAGRRRQGAALLALGPLPAEACCLPAGPTCWACCHPPSFSAH